MNNNYICYAILIVFFVWVGYIQIVGWRRTKGYRMNLETDLMDRYHEEVMYQLCYKRGYHVTMDMNEDAYWQITDTDHPSKKRVKFIAFIALVRVAIFPFNYRTNRNPDFDDYDPKWEVPIPGEAERDATEVAKEILDTAE
jgi:hypothetical protein